MRLKPLKQNAWFWGGLLLAIGLLERWILYLVYPVKAYNDTDSYRRLGNNILNGWAHYDGTRVPGYPLFMAGLGPNDGVYLAQLALGLIITLLMFFVTWRISGSLVLGFLVGLAHTLNLGQLFFEASLMSETLATFWVVLATSGAVLWVQFPRWRKGFLPILIGTAAVCAGLVRPLYLFLPFWIGLAVAVIPGLAPADSFGQRLRRLDWRFFLLACLPGLILTGVWVNYIHTRFHVWNVTTMTGYNLIQHTGYYFEYVPDRYAKLRDTYIQFRDARIAKYGTQGNAIWDAIPKMRKVSGENFVSLSTLLGELSMQLIWEHPTLYLHYAIQGWWLYWRVPVYWAAENLRFAGAAAWVSRAVLVERVGLFGANMFFLVSSLGLAVWPKARRAIQIPPAFWLLAATLWVTSILETLPDHGDNPRFLIPMQSLVVLWVFYIVYRLICGWLENRRFQNQLNLRSK